MDYKKILKDILIPNKRGINQKKLNRILYNQQKYSNIFDYLLNKVYKDSASIYETLKRIQLNIDVKPLCPICHKPVNFIGKTSKMFSKYCSNSCRAKDPKNYNNWIEGQKKYNKEHYGVEYNWQRNDIKEHRKEQLIKHYGTINLHEVDELKEKMIQTSLIHWGTKNPMQSSEIKNRKYITQKHNNSFNKSKPEDQSYKLLKEKYPDIIRQYKSKLYPFACDFYIPSLDLYIECNYHWTHGGHPFDKNNIEDNKKLQMWESKNTKFYNNAINVWTIRDTEKLDILKTNKLNYLIFFHINDFYEWLKKQE